MVKIVSRQQEETLSRTRLTWADPPLDDWLHRGGGGGGGEMEQGIGEMAERGEENTFHICHCPGQVRQPKKCRRRKWLHHISAKTNKWPRNASSWYAMTDDSSFVVAEL